MSKKEALTTLLYIFAAAFMWQLGCAIAEVAIEWHIWRGVMQ